MGTDVFERLWRAAKEQETKKALLREKLWREELENNNNFQPRFFRRRAKGTSRNKRRSASDLAPAPAAAPRDVVREAGEGWGEGEIGSDEAAASTSAGSGSASVLSAVGHMCCSGPASMGQEIRMSFGSEPEGEDGSSRAMALQLWKRGLRGLAERDIPAEVYIEWKNSRGHLSFRIAILASPLMFTLASSLAKRAPLEEVDHGAMSSNGAWLSIDLMASLPSLASNKKLYVQVHRVYSKLVYQCPELLLRALAVVPSATAGRLRVEILSELLSLDFRPICGMRAAALIRRLLQVDPRVSGVEAFNVDSTVPNVVYMYDPKDLKMNIKFEIEMLSQSFKVALVDAPMYSCLRTWMVPQKGNNDNFNIVKVTIQDTMQQANALAPEAVADGERTARKDPRGFAEGGNQSSVTETWLKQKQQQQQDQQTMKPNLAHYVTINLNLEMSVTQPHLKEMPKKSLPVVVGLAIREIIQPMMERSMTIICVTWKDSIQNDFAIESDENKMRKTNMMDLEKTGSNLARKMVT